MEEKEKIDHLLVDIRELEKLVAGMRDAEIYSVSFFGQSYAIAQKILNGLHGLEADQAALFNRLMEEHKLLIRESLQQTAPIPTIPPLEKEPTIATEPIKEPAAVEISPIRSETREEPLGKNDFPMAVAPNKEPIQRPAVSLDQTLIHSISFNEVLEKRILSDFRKAFSLNDRFRFRRDLFGGDEARMNKAISELNDMQSYEESVAYLNNSLNWNIEDEAVADFIRLIEKRFA